MRGLSARLAANLIWVVLMSAGIVAAAFLTYASGVLFDDSYRVSVSMPEAGGVLSDQEVTVLGHAVGQVERVELVERGVRLILRIEGDQEVPAEPVVQVLRRSPIGEQAVDFQPTEADWTAAEPGSHIEPVEAIVPAEVPVLLENTRELFAAIGVEDLSTVVTELGTALQGRGATLRQLNRDGLELNRTFVDGIPEFERVIEASSTVLEELREHRTALAEQFTNSADLTEIFAEQAPTLETLLDTGTDALRRLDTLVADNDANLSCLFGDLLAANDMMLGPSTWDGANPDRYDSKLDEFEQALVRNRFFFQLGFFVITQNDPTTGAAWQRINFTSDQAQGQAYAEMRPTPATLPGAACSTEEFGVGVNAVRQDDAQPADLTSPGIDYAPLVNDGDASRGGPATASGGDVHGAPAGSLPATGGSAIVLAPSVAGFAVWLRRRL